MRQSWIQSKSFCHAETANNTAEAHATLKREIISHSSLQVQEYRDGTGYSIPPRQCIALLLTPSSSSSIGFIVEIPTVWAKVHKRSSDKCSSDKMSNAHPDNCSPIKCCTGAFANRYGLCYHTHTLMQACMHTIHVYTHTHLYTVTRTVTHTHTQFNNCMIIESDE